MPGEGWAQLSAPTGQPPWSPLLTVPGISLKRAASLQQVASLYTPQEEAQGSTCQKQTQRVEEIPPGERSNKQAWKAPKTVRSLGKRTLPAGTLGQGHCRAQPFSSSPEAACPQDQQWLLWSLGSSLLTGNKH